MTGKNVLAAGMTAALLAAMPTQRCAAEIPAPLLACSAEVDDAKRLACFDRAVAQMGKTAEAATAARAGTPADPSASAGSLPVPAAAVPPPSPPATAPAAAPAAASAAAAVAATPPSVASASPPPRSPEEDFGLRTERDRPSQQLSELNATATAISTKPHG